MSIHEKQEKVKKKIKREKKAMPNFYNSPQTKKERLVRLATMQANIIAKQQQERI